MPQHKSAIKRTRQFARRAERNKAKISKMKTLIKKVRSSKSKADATIALKKVSKYLDQISAKGVIHKKNAANKKSKLAKFASKLA